MPNRLIREGFLDSEAINSLSTVEECWYHRLLLIVDDAGRCDGRPQVISSKAYPLRTKVLKDQVDKALHKLEYVGLIIIYTYQGKPYVQLTRVSKYGSSVRSKFPWKDGTYEFNFIEMETREGKKEFVATSLPPADPLPTPCGGGLDRSQSFHTKTKTKTKTFPPNPPRGQEGDSDRRGDFDSMLLDEIPKASEKLKTAWSDWVEHCRSSRRQRLTVLSAANLLKQISSMGEKRAIAAISFSIAGGYKGLIEPKQGQKQSGDYEIKTGFEGKPLPLRGAS